MMHRDLSHRNLKGMKEGVAASECVMIVLSGRVEKDGQADTVTGKYEGPFTRWFCHEEMSTARQTVARIIGVMETDERHNKPDFVQEKLRAWTGGTGSGAVHEDVEENLKLLDDACFVPLRRQQHEIPAMLGEILRQALPEPEPEPELKLQPQPEPVPDLGPALSLPEGVPYASAPRPTRMLGPLMVFEARADGSAGDRKMMRASVYSVVDLSAHIAAKLDCTSERGYRLTVVDGAGERVVEDLEQLPAAGGLVQIALL